MINLNDLYIPKYLQDTFRNTEIYKVNTYLLYYYFLKSGEGEQRKRVLKYFLNRKFAELKEYRKRRNKIIESLKNNKYITDCFQATLIENAIPGLGISSVFETGIFLNFIYGFPYIPASSLKGITSDYAIFYEGKNEKDKDYINVFGNQEREGKVIFFDALPVQDNNIFDLDVMTPHFQEYYSGKAFPGDYLKPNPIVFLVIKKGIVFDFCLASKDKNAFNTAILWVKGALEQIGVGGKTSVGYGHFSIKK